MKQRARVLSERTSEGGMEEWAVAPTISEVTQLLHQEEWVGAAAGLRAELMLGLQLPQACGL